MVSQRFKPDYNIMAVSSMEDSKRERLCPSYNCGHASHANKTFSYICQINKAEICTRNDKGSFFKSYLMLVHHCSGIRSEYFDSFVVAFSLGWTSI